MLEQNIVVLYSDDDNKIIVWDLENESQAYSRVFSDKIRQVICDTDRNLIAVSLPDSIVVLSAESGEVRFESQGSDYVEKGAKLFSEQGFIYVSNDSIIIRSLPDFEIVKVIQHYNNLKFGSACFVGPEHILASSSIGTEIYKNYHYVGNMPDGCEFADNYVVSDGMLGCQDYNKNISFIDLNTRKVEHTVRLEGRNRHEIVGEHIYYINDGEIDIRNLFTEKRLKKIAFQMDKVYEHSLSADAKRLFILGRFESEMSIALIDLESHRQIPVPVRQDDVFSYAQTAVFSDDGKNIYQIYKEGVVTNDLVTGFQLDAFELSSKHEISALDFPPLLINSNQMLLKIKNKESFRETLMLLDISTSKEVWSWPLPEGFPKIKIDLEKNEMQVEYEVYDDGVSTYHYTVVDVLTGKLRGDISIEGNQKSLVSFHDSRWLVIRDSMLYSGNYETLQSVSWLNRDGKPISHKAIRLGGTSLWSAIYKDGFLYATDHERLYKCNLKKPDSDYVSYALSSEMMLESVLSSQKVLLTDYSRKNYNSLLFNIEHGAIEKDSLSILNRSYADSVLFLSSTKDELYRLAPNGDLYPLGFNKNIAKVMRLNANYFGFESEDSIYLYNDKKEIVEDVIGKSYVPTPISVDGKVYYEDSELRYVSDGYLYKTLDNDVNKISEWKNVELNADGSKVFFFNGDSKLQSLDLADGILTQHTAYSENQNINEAYFRVLNNNFVIAADKLDATLFNFCNLSEKTVKSAFGNTELIKNFKLSDDGKTMLLETDNGVRVFDLSSATHKTTLTAVSYLLLNNRYVVFDNSETVRLYDIQENDIVWSAETSHANYKTHFGGLLDEKIILVNGSVLELVELHSGHVAASLDLKQETRAVIESAVYLKDSIFYVNVGSDFKPELRKFSLKENKITESKFGKKDMAYASYIVKEFELEGPHSWAVEDSILFDYHIINKQVRIASVSTGKILYKADMEIGNLQMDIIFRTEDSAIYVATRSGEVYFYNYKTGLGSCRSMKLKADKFIFNQGYIYASDFGKKIDVYTIDSNVSKFSIVPLSGENHIVYLPTGEYMSTSSGARNLKFRVDSSIFSFEQFDAVFNRPDKVINTLPMSNDEMREAYQRAYAKRVQRHPVRRTLDWREMPTVMFEDQSDENIVTIDSIYEFKISCIAAKSPVSRVEIIVNDHSKIYTFSGMEIHENIAVELSSGMNTISIMCFSENGMASTTKKRNVQYTNPNPVSNVYFFGMGISSYDDENYNLNYAAKDTRDLARVLKNRYQDIKIDTLINEHATRNEFLKWKSKLASLSVDDIVFFSFCGHGVLDDSLNWFFATHTIDFTNPNQAGISYDDLMQVIGSCPSRKKIVTLDACHSGEIDVDQKKLVRLEKKGEVVSYARGAKVISQDSKGYDSYTLMKELFADFGSVNGTVVISASGGMEFAYENEQYKNGVFTFSMIETLESEIWNTLKVSNLQTEVIRKVENRTNGMQKPTVRAGVLNYDWVVW